MNRKLKIIDNTGVTEGKLIKILNKKKELDVGSLIVLRITKNIAHSKIRKGEVHKGVIVTSSWIEGPRGVILVKVKKKEYLPIGTRIKGLVSSSLKRMEGCERILSIVKRTI